MNIVTFQTSLEDHESIRCAADHIIQVNRKLIHLSPAPGLEGISSIIKT